MDPPWVLLDVGGVGYEIEVPNSTLVAIGGVGEACVLHIHHHISEATQHLFGFAQVSDRGLFRSLLKVSGIGGKTALAVLSTYSAGEFANLVADKDAAGIARVSGIGKKTAERMIIELADKLDGIAPSMAVAGGARSVPVGAAALEAQHALEALGYKPAEVSRMLRAVADQDADAQTLIRQALKSQVQRS